MFFSRRARYCCAAGWSLRNNTAASEKGPVRWALPIVAPEVPRRLPADALRHFPRRQEGEDILYPGEAVDLVDVVEQHEAENRADTGHGLQQIPGVGVMVVGGCDDGECHVAKPLGIGGDERQIDWNFLHRWIGKACGNALTVGFVGDLLPMAGR